MIREQEFACRRDALTIRGTLFLPEGGPHPIAVVSHGFMDTRKGVARYARMLAEEGYAAFTFDFCGGSVKSESDGLTTDMTVLTEVEDLLSVIAYAKNLDETDPDHLLLMGGSQGGFVSALAAARLLWKVDKLILFFPALCIPDDARRGRMIMAKFNPDKIPDIVKCGPMKLGRAYPETMQEVDPFEAIRPYYGPVLIVHGTKDGLVNIDYSRRAKEAYGENCTLKEIAGADHGFKGDEDTLAMSYVKEFLKNRDEILTIDVRLTEAIRKKNGMFRSTLTLPFVGTAQSEWFTGAILPGAADIQQFKGKQMLSACADYRMKGTDLSGKDCTVHVINRNDGTGWKPEVETDSEALAFLNGADCGTVLEMRKVGPIVHIFAPIPGKKQPGAEDRWPREAAPQAGFEPEFVQGEYVQPEAEEIPGQQTGQEADAADWQAEKEEPETAAMAGTGTEPAEALWPEDEAETETDGPEKEAEPEPAEALWPEDEAEPEAAGPEKEAEPEPAGPLWPEDEAEPEAAGPEKEAEPEPAEALWPENETEAEPAGTEDETEPEPAGTEEKAESAETEPEAGPEPFEALWPEDETEPEPAETETAGPEKEAEPESAEPRRPEDETGIESSETQWPETEAESASGETLRTVDEKEPEETGF